MSQNANQTSHTADQKHYAEHQTATTAQGMKSQKCMSLHKYVPALPSWKTHEKQQMNTGYKSVLYSLPKSVSHWSTSIDISLMGFMIHIIDVGHWSACLHIMMVVLAIVIQGHALYRVLWDPSLGWQIFSLVRPCTQSNAMALYVNTCQAKAHHMTMYTNSTCSR